MKHKKRKANSLLAVLLCFCMLIPITGNPAFAAPAETGLCEHHTEHTEECGYQEGQDGQPCSHEHDASCGYAEGQPCNHQHNEDCGYVEAVEAAPCGFVCALCSGEPIGIELGDEPITITAEDCKDGCPGHLLTGNVELKATDSDPVLTISGGTHTLIMDGFSFEGIEGKRQNGLAIAFDGFLVIDENADVTLQVQNKNKIDFASNGNKKSSIGITVYEGSGLTIVGENKESSKLEILTYDGIGIGADDYDFDLGYRGVGDITVQDCTLDVSVNYNYSYEVAIGGRFNVQDGEVSGKIKIIDSDVTTKGSIGQSYGAGASNAEGDGWDISIENSSVTVTQASRYCAAIGGGGCSDAYSGVNKGIISIVNSTVNADAMNNNGYYGAAIGGAKGQGSGVRYWRRMVGSNHQFRRKQASRSPHLRRYHD